MATWTPDPSFYPSPRMAMKARAGDAGLRRGLRSRPQDARRDRRGRRRSRTRSTYSQDRRHGRRCPTPATSCTTSAGTPAPPACARTRRTRMSSGATWWCRACAPRASTSSTPSPIPKNPKIVKVIEPEEVAEKAGYTRPHTIHCGPEGIYVAALGNAEGKGPGGIFLMDHESFDVRGQWEIDRGPQQLAYDAWWHLGHDTHGHQRMGHARHVRERARSRRCCSARKYGRRLHFWDLHKRKHLQTIDFGDEYQLVFELRPAHDPTKAYGFVNCVISLKNLSSSIWTWYRDGDKWAVKKVIEIPAEPAEPGPCCRRCSRASRRCRRWSPTSTCRWTTSSSTSPAGAPATCSNTTSPIRSTPSSPARCGSAASSSRATHPGAKNGALERRPADGRDQPRRQARLLHQLALRRHRPAVLSGRHRRLDGQARRQRPTAASPSTRSSSSTGRSRTARTRCGWKAATARRIPTAIRDAPRARCRRRR